MIRIGRTPQNVGGAAQTRRSQATLADLYQLFAQASRNPGQSTNLVWYTLNGDYSLTVLADIKRGSVWRLSFRGKIESTVLWTVTTNDVAQVHNQIMNSMQ